MAQFVGALETADVATAFGQELAAAGFGVFADGAQVTQATIFSHEEPTTPDAIITVFQVGGGQANVDIVGDAFVVQVRVRSAPDDISEALTRANSINNAFRRRDGPLGPSLVAFVESTSTPETLGREDGAQRGGRWRIVQTFRVLVKA